MKKQIYKEVNFDNLPKINIGNNKTGISWINSIDLEIKFKYGKIEGILIIKSYNKTSHYISVLYNNKIFTTTTSDLLNCNLGHIVGRITLDFRIEIGRVIKDEKRDLIIVDREYRLGKTNNQKIKYYKYHCNKFGVVFKSRCFSNIIINNKIYKGFTLKFA